MDLTFEDVELLARLEIEVNLDNEDLSRLVEHLGAYSEFDVPQRITDFFLRGVEYGLTVNDETTTFDLELEMINVHGELSGSGNINEDNEKIQENFEKLFSAIFMNGTHWAIQHRLVNDKI